MMMENEEQEADEDLPVRKRKKQVSLEGQDIAMQDEHDEDDPQADDLEMEDVEAEQPKKQRRK